MKKRFYQLGKQVLSLSAVIASALLFSNQVSAQGVSINGTGTGTAPNSSAILDLDVSGLGATAKKGFLFPRVALTGTTDAATIPSPATSLTVYNTATGGGVSPGFYYNSGTPGSPTWVSIGGSGSAPTQGLDTDVSGTQVDIEPILNFVHTISSDMGIGADQPLTLITPASYDIILQAGGTEKARILSSGELGIGDATPLALFTVGSGDKFRVNTSGDLIRINDVPYTWPAANATVNGQILASTTAGALTWSSNIPASDADYIWNQIASAQTAPSNFWISNIGKIDGGLQLKGSGANYTTITSAATGNYTLTLPVDAGNANQVLATDGSGSLSWATPMTNPMNSTGDMIYGVGVTGTPTELNSATGILHGTAGAAPTWAPVNMAGGATEISGILPVGNGGIGIANPTSGSLLLGAGTFAMTALTGSANYTIYHNGATWATNSGATTGLLSNGTSVGVGVAPVLPASGGAFLDITGSNDGTTTPIGLQLRNGDGQNLPSDAVQITLGYNGTTNHRHNIRTRHNSLAGTANAIDFYLWKPGTDANGVLGSNRVFTLFNDGTYSGVELYGGIYTNASWGSSGQVLVSGGAGVAPTWTNAATGTVTSVTGTAPIYVATGTTTPVISIQGTAGGVTYGTGIGTSAAFTGSGTVAGQILQSNTTGAPTWSTPTYPSASGTTGKILRSDGTNNIYTTSTFADTYPINTILYAGTANTVTGLATVNSSVLTTTAGGVPTWANPNTIMPLANNGLNINTTAPAPATGEVELGGTLVRATTVNQSTFALTIGGGTGTININDASTTALTNIGTGATTGTVTIGGSSAQSIAIGDNATGAKTITIGSGAVANTITIGNNTGATATNIRGGTTGAVNINAATGAATPVNIASGSTTGDVVIGNATGYVGIGGAINTSYKMNISGRVKSTGINETSDVRLKKNFASIDGALAKVLSMNGKYYDWRTTEFPDKGLSEGRQVGVIAQEIEKILPEVVTTGDDGYKAVEYGHIVPLLIEAIKEQQNVIDGQRLTITELKASLENVLNRVNIIEKNSDLSSSKVEK